MANSTGRFDWPGMIHFAAFFLSNADATRLLYILLDIIVTNIV